MRISGLDAGRPVTLDERADSVSLALSDATNGRWRLRVWAKSPDGDALVCTLETAAPTAGSGPTRWVGFAHVPGATAWYVEPYLIAGSAAPDHVADLYLAAHGGPSGFVGGAANGGFAALVP